MRRYEDLEVGETRRSATLLVTGDAIVDFARRYDPQWFHADPQAAAQSVFGELVASGIHSLALWRQLDHSINGDIDWVCGVAWEDTRWHRGLRAGTEVHVVSEILDKRPSASDPSRGVVRVRCALVAVDGRPVVSFVSVNLVHTRASRQGAPGAGASVGKLDEH